MGSRECTRPASFCVGVTMNLNRLFTVYVNQCPLLPFFSNILFIWCLDVVLDFEEDMLVFSSGPP